MTSKFSSNTDDETLRFLVKYFNTDYDYDVGHVFDLVFCISTTFPSRWTEVFVTGYITVVVIVHCDITPYKNSTLHAGVHNTHCMPSLLTAVHLLISVMFGSHFGNGLRSFYLMFIQDGNFFNTFLEVKKKLYY